MEKSIRKYALQNALKFKGKANLGAILPKLLGEDQSLKSKIKEIMPLIQQTVSEVNSLSLEEQTKALQELAPELLEEKPKEKKGLKELSNVKDKVVMRFAPSPSGPMHIGHAITGCLSDVYVKKYGGEFILRIEDTNASNIYPPAYDMMKEEGKWLFSMMSSVVIQSDRMQLYYDHVKELLEKELAYVCTCAPEDFKKNSDDMVDCPCRNLEKNEQLSRWENMFEGFKPGEAVARFKTSMQDKNPAMRDFPLCRINEEEHPKTGTTYRVWPLMNLSVAVDDMELGMTHIIRGKDHMDNAKKQAYLFEAFGKPVPESYFIGRIKFDDLEVSSSKTKEKIEAGEFTGWDDIRLPFLEALRRRGYQPGAFAKLATEVGLSQADKVMSKDEYFKTLSAFNKELIEEKGKRYFFLKDPTPLTVDQMEEVDVELDLHPDHHKGGRNFTVNERFLIEKEDFDKFNEGEVIRFMDCANIKKSGIIFEHIPGGYEEFKDLGKKIIHWLPDHDSQLVDVQVLMPDMTVLSGKGEKSLESVSVGDVIQFERFGFCRLDSVENGTFKFWFGHK